LGHVTHTAFPFNPDAGTVTVKVGNNECRCQFEEFGIDTIQCRTTTKLSPHPSGPADIKFLLPRLIDSVALLPHGALATNEAGKPVEIRRGRATVIEPDVTTGSRARSPSCSTSLERDAQSQEDEMTITAFAPSLPQNAIPLRELVPWAIFGGLICLLAIYFVGAEEGATSLISGMYVHEFVHDGRHLLGFPCH
jgi:hypothetical protein